MLAGCDDSAFSADETARAEEDEHGHRASMAETLPSTGGDPSNRVGARSEAAVNSQRPTAEPPTQPPLEPCVVPAVPIPRPRECDRGRSYPDCKWQMPHATLSEGRYRRWRNTIMEHWWGRPALVAFLLASVDRYRARFPDQVLAIGDLDAPGPRHQTHDVGRDVDIYLPGVMLVENVGGGEYVDNYADLPPIELEEKRRRVEGLARVLAECSEGKLRIYYNDAVVRERFHAWYGAQGFEPDSELGPPMQAHNHLHDFHFHISVPTELPMCAVTPLPTGERHPRKRIEEPPDPNSAPNLASRNRNTTWQEDRPDSTRGAQERSDDEPAAPRAREGDDNRRIGARNPSAP